MRERMLDDYLLWEQVKPFIYSVLGTADLPVAKLETRIQEVRERWNETDFTTVEKLRLVEDRSTVHRARLVQACDWRKESYDVSALGTVLPETGDLPPSVISQALPDVIDFVDSRMDNDTEINSIDYISQLTEIPDIITKFPPLVIEPARLQRNQQVMRDHPGLTVVDTDGYIEDGNHRAIATVLATDSDTIDCHVGTYQE